MSGSLCFRSEEATFNAQERENFARFCVVFATDFVPYINRCLRSLFPAKQLTHVLGISIAELNKMVIMAVKQFLLTLFDF